MSSPYHTYVNYAKFDMKNAPNGSIDWAIDNTASGTSGLDLDVNSKTPEEWTTFWTELEFSNEYWKDLNTPHPILREF